MIKTISVINDSNQRMDMVLARPEESGFVITSVEGLGSGEVVISTTDISTLDGGLYNSARKSIRNIVLNLDFMTQHNYKYYGPYVGEACADITELKIIEREPLCLSIEECRHKSQKYFPLKKEITLIIETDTRLLEISGRVEKNEPDIFSDKEGTQISIVCAKPWFKDIAHYGEENYISGVDKLFEFPFSNESLSVPLLEFGIAREYPQGSINYIGDVSTGFVMVIAVDDMVGNITIFNVTQRTKIEINTVDIAEITGGGLVKGDEIIISSVAGNKSAILNRKGKRINIMNALLKSIDFDKFTLSKGDNEFAIYTDKGLSSLEFKIINDTLYEGI